MSGRPGIASSWSQRVDIALLVPGTRHAAHQRQGSAVPDVVRHTSLGGIFVRHSDCHHQRAVCPIAQDALVEHAVVHVREMQRAEVRREEHSAVLCVDYGELRAIGATSPSYYRVVAGEVRTAAATVAKLGTP